MEQGAKALLRILLGALVIGAIVVGAHPKYRATAAAPMAYAELAEILIAAADPKGARAAADKGRSVRPGSPGAARCENIIRDIESPEITLKAERV